MTGQNDSFARKKENANRNNQLWTRLTGSKGKLAAQRNETQSNSLSQNARSAIETFWHKTIFVPYVQWQFAIQLRSPSIRVLARSCKNSIQELASKKL